MYKYNQGIATVVHLLGLQVYTYAGSFQRRRFTNEDVMVTLPDGVDACDIGTITI
jgi:hypothetical protein